MWVLVVFYAVAGYSGFEHTQTYPDKASCYEALAAGTFAQSPEGTAIMTATCRSADSQVATKTNGL